MTTLQIRLNPLVPWEALLARYLEGLSASRRRSRARELLVAGFREACWVQSQLVERPAFGWRYRRPAFNSAESTAGAAPDDGRERAVSPGRKPLTALAKVIG